MGVYLFLDIFAITLVRGFAFNFGLILLLETTGLVFIFVSVMYLTFNKILFVLKFGVTRKISEPNALYSKLFKTAPFAIISEVVIKKWSFKGMGKNPKRL